MRPIALLLALACGVLHAAPVVTLPGGKTIQLTQRLLDSVPRESVTATAHEVTTTCEGYDLRLVMKAAGLTPVEGLRGKGLRLIVRVLAADGYQVVFALSDLDPTLGATRVFLVNRQDGRPLPPSVGPWRLVVPGDHRPARWVRQVTAIVVSAS